MKIELTISMGDMEENVLDEEAVLMDLFDFVRYTDLSVSGFLVHGVFFNLEVLNEYLATGHDNTLDQIGRWSWIPVVVTPDDYQQLISQLEQQYGKKLVKYPELESCRTRKEWRHVSFRVLDRRKKTQESSSL